MTQEAIESIENMLATHQPLGFNKTQIKVEAVQQIEERLFFYLFAIVTRWFDKRQIDISSSAFWQSRDHFGVLSTWQWTSLARLYLLLLAAERNSKEDYIQLYESIFNAADVQESIILIQSLAFVPCPEAFMGKAREAARSNITPLFSAVAHNSDYAFNYFDEAGWNQLILKAAFLNMPIVSIHGLQSRNNKKLIIMLRDYVGERQAASRSVPWDLWCCIAWDANGQESLHYLQQQYALGDIKTKAAIALALQENKHEQAKAVGNQLSQNEELSWFIERLTWKTIQNYEQ